MNDYKLIRNSFISGGSSLAISFSIMYPVDTIKVFLQSNKSSIKLFSRRTVKGFMPSVLFAIPQGGIRLSTYEYSKRKIGNEYPDMNKMLIGSLCATIADINSSVIKIPRELIAQRIQTNVYFNTLDSVKNIYRSNGFLGFYNGSISTVLRDIPFMITLFSSYEFFKQKYNKNYFLIGGMSGALAGSLTTPIDYLKTQKILSNQSMFDIIHNTYYKEGIRGFYKGGLYRTTWWFGVCSIFFPTYERIRKWSDNY